MNTGLIYLMWSVTVSVLSWRWGKTMVDDELVDKPEIDDFSQEYSWFVIDLVEQNSPKNRCQMTHHPPIPKRILTQLFVWCNRYWMMLNRERRLHIRSDFRQWIAHSSNTIISSKTNKLEKVLSQTQSHQNLHQQHENDRFVIAFVCCIDDRYYCIS